MSDYKKVELVWHGKRTEVERVRLPFQVVETINESKADREKNLLFRQRDEEPEGWRNKLIWGDNKYVMSSLLEEYAGKINLIYIDPPFATGADFSFKVEIGGEKLTKDASVLEEVAYRDTWGKGLESYLQMMYDRLVFMRELLSQIGSIYVHMDWHVGHYIKALMDEIFGTDKFRNEVIWHYEKWVSQSKSFQKNHDIILYYSKNDNYTFNIVKVITKNLEEKYKKGYLIGGGYGSKGLVVYDKYNPKVKEMIASGEYEVVYAGKEGKPMSDVWDIPFINPVSNERVSYSTQKPEALLERIFKASSNEGDLVADFFCGSGTTLAVAEKLNRKWIGCDLSKFAIHTTRKRLLGIEGCRPFDVLNLGLYEKHKLSANGFGHGLSYVKFVLDLYRAESLPGFAHIHGRKSGRLVHIGAVDSVITEREIRLAGAEAKEAGARGLDILGWDFEMGLHDLVDAVGDEYGLKVKLVQIPREALEVQDAKEKVKFYDLNYLDVEVKTEKRKVTVKLKDFAIANPEYLPEEVRNSVRKFTDFIDYWAVDFDYQGDTFHNMDQSYRTRKDRSLDKSLKYTYEKAGNYNILVRVVDIFGNDTTKLVKIKVR